MSTHREPRAGVGAYDAHAGSYDRTVAASSAYHDHLRISARRMGIGGGGGAGLRLLDIGCGTGASTAALLDVAPEAEIVAVDASAAMLEQARRKSWTGDVRFVHGEVEELGRAQVTGPFDGVMAAFLLQGLDDRNAALRVLRRLLKPGGPLAVHDAAVRDSARGSAMWTAMTWGVLVPAGLARTRDADLTKLMWRHVRTADSTEALATRMRACGFVDVRVQTMPGWQQRILHTFLGRRPTGPEPEPHAPPPPPAPRAAARRPSPRPRPPAGSAEPRPPAGNDAPTPPAGIDLTKH